MKGRQQKIVLQLSVFLLLILVAAHGSEGWLSHLFHRLSKQSEPISRVLLTRLTTEPSFDESRISEASFISPSLPPQESPIGGIVLSPGPAIYAAQPPSRESTSPTKARKNEEATTPTLSMVPEGPLQKPPTMSTKPEISPPAMLGLVPQAQPSSPSNHVSPVTRLSPPSRQPLPPSAPNSPVDAGAGSPVAGFNGQMHNNSSPVALPGVEGPVAPRTGGSNGDIATPTASPPEETPAHLSPMNQLQPKGTAVSPASVTAPALNGTSEPVSAPVNNFSSSASPHNNSPSKGPAVSPHVLANSPSIQHDQHRIPPAATPAQISAPTFSPVLANPPSIHKNQHRMPPAASPVQISSNPNNNSHVNGPAVSSAPSPPPTVDREKTNIPVAAPSNELPGPTVSTPPVIAPAINHGTPAHAPSTRPVHFSPESHPVPASVSSPAICPVPPEAVTPSGPRSSPPSYAKPTAGKIPQSPSPAPAVKSPPARTNPPAYTPSTHFPSESPPPATSPTNGQTHHPPAANAPGPSTPQHEGNNRVAPTPSLVTRPHNNTKGRAQPPVLPPTSVLDHQRAPKPQPIHAFPPPPPNLECPPMLCPEPLINSPPGSPCSCVQPINVGLRLGIPLYTFFSLVSELAKEIASGVLMEQSQVRIMGANADSENIDQTVVLIDLAPRGGNFSHDAFFMVYQKFWHKLVFIDPSKFGDYTVLYVRYPGLPPSPPSALGNLNPGESGVDPRTIHPLAVDVGQQKGKQNSGVIAIIVLSVIITVVLCVGGLLLLFLKFRRRSEIPASTPKASQPPLPGSGPTLSGSRHGSEPISFTSSMTPYTGTAKTFSSAEMERATNKFDNSKTIGEGGFGRVYEGTLDDGTRVAVKVLKRDDQQGSREFLAEVEMLSRLHHRNLIKLIGICTESHIRCLVYELLPNGSVESHLHGPDKEISPLDWNARLRIALGAARGLAYLHEDSSPRVIHRDFKSSNILLEEDFTPKVSDFGLARAALGEGHEYISTRVMGTFGYVAPEYAMTGHLLVKSDVYSYGVVLLELLTGRKPVDMLRPPGQESLVTWARPYLTSKEGLELIVDQSLGTDIPHDSLAKVAAIASMCVQPEVDQRPFMGEVVQALKLVCNDGDDYRGSEFYSQDDLPTHDKEMAVSMGWESESENVLSASEIFHAEGFTKDVSGSFRQYSSTGPLRPGNKGLFSQPTHGLSTGSTSDHGKYGRGLDTREQWP